MAYHRVTKIHHGSRVRGSAVRSVGQIYPHRFDRGAACSESPGLSEAEKRLSSMEPDTTVHVVDSDSLARNEVCQIVRAMKVRHEAHATGGAFLDALDTSCPGCLVTEVRVPDVSGLQIQRQLALDEVPLPVIFVSAYATVPVVVRAMQEGAVDFLEKPPRQEDLWETIQEAFRVDARRRLALRRKQQLKDQIRSLTPSERQVLELLADDNPMRAIASELELSVRTVELRRARMMKKLGLRSSAELLHFAITALDGHQRHIFELADGHGDVAGF